MPSVTGGDHKGPGIPVAASSLTPPRNPEDRNRRNLTTNSFAPKMECWVEDAVTYLTRTQWMIPSQPIPLRPEPELALVMRATSPRPAQNVWRTQKEND